MINGSASPHVVKKKIHHWTEFGLFLQPPTVAYDSVLPAFGESLMDSGKGTGDHTFIKIMS